MIGRISSFSTLASHPCQHLHPIHATSEQTVHYRLMFVGIFLFSRQPIGRGGNVQLHTRGGEDYGLKKLIWTNLEALPGTKIFLQF